MTTAKIDFTTEELRQVQALFDNSALLSGLRKIWVNERDYWRDKGDEEALTPNPSVPCMIQYAARALGARDAERTIREAVGIKGSR